MSGLSALFAPRSIAVVGASTRPQSLSHRMLRMMRDQVEGIELIAVNPSAEEIAGVPVVPALRFAPYPVDLAVVATPAQHVLGALDDALAAGVGAAAICSSGFGELGADGEVLQRELAERASRMRILGPNCQGLFYRPTGLVATFTPSIRDVVLPPPLPIAYVGQSGALGGAIADMLRERGVGLTAWVSTGNQVDVDVVEAAQHLVGDGRVRQLLLYIEEEPDGDRWVRLCAAARDAGVSVAVLRTGRSRRGREAIASHTGSLIGSGAAFDAVCRVHGVEVVGDIGGLIDRALITMQTSKAGAVAARGVAVLSSSGGAGALAADIADELGVDLPALSSETQEAIRPLLPAFASVQNPIDVTAQLFVEDGPALAQVCEILTREPAVGSVLIILSLVLDPAAETLAKRIVQVADQIPGEVYVAYLASTGRTERARNVLAGGGVPVFDSVGRALEAISSRGARATTPSDRSTAATEARTVSTSFGVLDEIGLRRPEVHAVRDAHDAVRIAGAATRGVVLKVRSPGMAHKSELGAVRVGVTADAAAHAFEELRELASHLDGAVIEAHSLAEPGIELLLSVVGSANAYPPLVTVGWGGTLVELLDDVVSFPAGTPRESVLEQCRRLRCWPMVEGYRGQAAHDADAVLDAIERVARWGVQNADRLGELEINPLIVHRRGAGVTAVDVLLRCGEG